MKTIQHKFVEFIPNILERGILYISVEYKSAVHLCVCGCGNKVVTPLSPIDWKLIYNGRSVSLRPSIGNWSFACKSHYFITENNIEQALPWSEKQIEKGRQQDQKEKKSFFKRKRRK